MGFCVGECDKLTVLPIVYDVEVNCFGVSHVDLDGQFLADIGQDGLCGHASFGEGLEHGAVAESGEGLCVHLGDLEEDVARVAAFLEQLGDSIGFEASFA
jgi:uncharacterized NAD(P)/FAD-binding protein YdhS